MPCQYHICYNSEKTRHKVSAILSINSFKQKHKQLQFHLDTCCSDRKEIPDSTLKHTVFKQRE